jgi:hypothetical protein
MYFLSAYPIQEQLSIQGWIVQMEHTRAKCSFARNYNIEALGGITL